MAKQLNVEMSFTADTSKARQQIQELQKSLSQLSSGISIKNKGLAITKDIQEGMQAASQLQVMLEKATNVNTGKLDLTKFTQSLNAGNTNLNQLRISLEKLGPQGSQAFLQVARSISNANTPLLSINKRFSTLMTTLKNTAKWQISSSILHGFIGAVQGAYRYAQDLNESLNNIRIRTGQSTDEMAKFADQANRAAKELSTTTTAYTNAALIYYQQGLDDQQVKERTDITVKMANVTKDSAETVSQQLTAVWNNFDKTGEKLEYIADVMNALGAATASSTSEIATGLQKFAAVAETAGMSYEYAASALATITAVTRQSADTVGTGLRTVLARIESLNLGETLEDGVGLTKYTKALEKIGVQVLDTNGQLKAADEILDSMAEKWQGLTDAQKMATAETVGGIRQYSTIMALMENWDFMQKNVGIAKNAEGTLQEQADIYAESWEAAGKRVKAAAQAIYTDLIDDKFFITILNGVEKIITFVDDLIRSLGGLPGLLSTIGAIVFKIFGPQITNGLITMTTALKSLTPSGQAQIQAQKDMAWNEAQVAASNLAKNGQSNYAQQLSTSMQQEAVIQRTLIDNAEKMSDLEKESYQIQLDGLRTMEERNIEQAKYLDNLEEEISLQSKKIIDGTTKEDRQNIINMSRQAGAFTALTTNFDTGDFGEIGLNPAITTAKQLEQELQIVQDTFNKLKIDAPIKEDIQFIQKEIKNLTTEEFKIKLDDADFQRRVGKISSYITNTSDKINNKLQENIKNLIPGDGKDRTRLENLSNAAEKAGEGYVSLSRASATAKKSMDDLNNSIQSSNGNMNAWATNIVSTAQRISSISMGINSVVGSINTLKQGIENGNLSISQMLSMISSLAMGFTMMIPAILTSTESLSNFIAAQIASTAAQNVDIIAAGLSSQTHYMLSRAIKEENAALVEQLLVEKGVIPEKYAHKAAEDLLSVSKKKGTLLSEEETAAILAESLGEQGATLTKGQYTIATTVQTIAQKLFNTELEISTALMLGYIAIVLAVVAAIAALAYGLSKLIVTQKEAQENIQKATEAYNEEKEKLDSLKNSLQEVQDQIDKLNSKKTLSIVEQKELNQLERRKNLLERQVELQEQLAKYKQKEQAETIEKNFSTAFGIKYSQAKGTKDNYFDEQQLENNYNQAKQTYENSEKTEADLKKWVAAQEQYANAMAYAKKVDQEWLAENSKAISEAEENFLLYLQAIEDGAITYNEKTLSGMVDTIAEGRRAMADTVDDYYTDLLSDVFQSEDINLSNFISEALTGELDSNDLDDKLRRILLELGYPIDDFIDAVNNKVNDFVDKFGKDSEPIKQWLKSLTEEQLELALTLDVNGTENVDELNEKLAQAEEQAEQTQAALDKISFKQNYSGNLETLASLKSGDTTISADQYNALGGAGEGFFTQSLDGQNYEFTGQVDQLEGLLKGQARYSFGEDILKGQAYQTYQNIDRHGSEQASQEALEPYKQLAEETGQTLEQVTAEFENQANSLRELQEEYALSCTSLADLDNAVNTFFMDMSTGQTNVDAYQTGLINLANQYDNCSSELERYKKALEDGNEKQQEAAEQALKLSIRSGELGKKYDIAAEDIENYAKQLKSSGKYEEASDEALVEMAKDQLRYDKAVTSTTSNLSKWKTALATAAKTGMLATDSAEELAEAYGDLLDIDGSQLSADFLKNSNNLQLLEDAINGVDGAYEQLQQAAQKDLNIQLNLDDNIINQFDEIENRIANVPEGIDIGAYLDDADFLDELSNLVNAAGMTADEATAYLSSMGIDAEVEEVPAQTTSVPVTEDFWVPPEYQPYTIDTGGEMAGKGSFTGLHMIRAGHWQPVQSSHEEESAPSSFSLRVTSANKSSGGNIKHSRSAPANSGGGGKGGGGGGGGSAPKAAKTQKSEPKKVDRYKEITDTIDDLTKSLEKTNTVSDRLWGKDRLSSMQKANDILKKQADAYREKARQAEAFLKVDRNALQNTLKASWVGENETDSGMERIRESFGNLEFQFDVDGDISNYTEIMQKITDIYNARQAYWANPNNFSDADAQSRYENLYVKPMEEQIALIEEAINQYEETKGVWEDNLEAAEEARRAWQDNNFEQLEYKLELKIEVDDAELEKLEYYIDKMSDDFYLRAENLVNYIGKVDVAEDKLKNYAQAVQDLNTQYENGEISQEAYYEKLKEIQSEEYKELQNLKELDDEIAHYFGETLEAGQEELEKYTNRLDHINEVLGHYKEIMSLLGKSTDYKMIGKVLEGVANNTMNSYLAAKSYYDQLSIHREALEKQLAGLEVGSAEYKTVKQELDDMVEAHEEAENKMYEKAEETAEAYQALWENTVESIQHDFEMMATNGMGFDFLNDSLDRLSSRQDEYLTKTNQIYEMNDLLRKLQADLDKTTNAAAKQRIANFSREMEQLKNKNELSKLDLDIAKARYQQMLAEIALEEAQNAKSMVRLRRDSEGNYGYMYTADQDKIGKAEDDLAKANNDLYNIVLNATNDYTQKQLQLEQDFKDKLAEIDKKAATDENYRNTQYWEDRAKLQREFENLSKTYTEQYNTAIYWLNETAITDQYEAWTQYYDGLMLKAADWNELVAEYTKESQEAMEEYVKNLNPLIEGPNSIEIAEEGIDALATKSKNLTDQIIGEDGLVHALGEEFTGVLDTVNGYLETHQKYLGGVITEYEILADRIGDVLRLQAIENGMPLSTDEQSIINAAKNASRHFDSTMSSAASMASGGYTGAWGGYGKLALLHEKELVLNSTDTENLLMSVDILRRLSTALDLQAMSAGIASMSATSNITNGGNMLAQDVTIHAEFPNAVDHNEIEMAFDSLINRASQYAGRF